MKTLQELAEIVDGELVGPPSLLITGVAGVREVRAGEITYVEGRKLLPFAETSAASALLLPPSLPSSKPSIIVRHPKLAFATLLDLFYPMPLHPPGIDPSACIDGDARIGDGSFIGPHVTIEEGATVGSNVQIGSGTFIGAQVDVQDGTFIYPNVTILRGTKIGRGVVIHSGTVIGSDGFGYIQTETGAHRKIPQVGNVIIGDEVEIGASVTIDRATTGSTTIGRRTKIDNLVQIAHNVTVGEDVIIVSHAAIAGSCTIGNGVIIAGMAGIKEHVVIGEHAIIGGRASVLKDVPAGSFVSGHPARPHREEMKLQAALHRLPELLEHLDALKKKGETS